MSNKKYGVLDVVTSKFNLFDHGRTDGNGRGYLVNSVKKLIESPLYQERLKLGELYGYFGHNLRQMAGKMDLDEVSVIQYDGKPVVIETVPSNRHVDLQVADDGIVTHTQEILDTPSGRAVKAMRDAGIGGWSWAVMGVETAIGAVARSFHGFDFVKHPSYIDVDKQQAMFESVGVSSEGELLEAMFEQAGFDSGQSQKMLNILERRTPSILEYQAITQEVMMLESALSTTESQLAKTLVQEEQRSQRMFEAIKAAPIFTSERQLQALTDMATDEDKAIVMSLFESLAQGVSDLPLGHAKGSAAVNGYSKKPVEMDYAIDFGVCDASPFAPR